MRTTLIFLFALIAGTAFAQAPVIDSMLIDESKGILSVYGDFGTAQGKIRCDNLELPVLTWSDLVITATIPDTGIGSAGGVVVEDVGGVSNERLISLWKGRVYSYHIERHSIDDIQGHTLLFRLRLDLQNLLQTQAKERLVSFSRHSKYHNYFSSGTQYSPDYGYDVDFSLNDTVEVERDSIDYLRGFSGYNRLHVESPSLFIRLQKIRGLVGTRTGTYESSGPYTVKYLVNIDQLDFYVELDSEYRLINFVKRDADTVFYSYSKTEEVSGEQFFLPVKTISLRFTPSIIAPKDKRTNLGTDDILLKWDSLKYMDAYHIQLSKDSLVNGQRAGQAQQGVAYIVDTIVSSLDFALPPLEKNTKYYWRVCGVNTEGESRWSDVCSFTTGTSADVKQESTKSTSLACYPNPAMKELTIVTTEPTRLLLYDVTGKIIKSEQAASNQTKWDVSLLPNGTYILGTSSGDVQVVRIVK